MNRIDRNHPNRIPSFRELEERRRVNVKLFVEVLEEYAYSGAAINPRVVLPMLQKGKRRFTRDHRSRIDKAITAAVLDNTKRGQLQTSNEYAELRKFRFLLKRSGNAAK